MAAGYRSVALTGPEAWAFRRDPSSTDREFRGPATVADSRPGHRFAAGSPAQRQGAATAVSIGETLPDPGPGVALVRNRLLDSPAGTRTHSPGSA